MPRSLELVSSVSAINGIGNSTSQKLEKLSIYTVSDLLNHFPTRYLDYTHRTKISELQTKKPASFIATIGTPKTFFSKSKKLITQASAEDSTGKITLTWFNNPYIKRTLKPNSNYSVAGIPSQFGDHLTIISPSLEEGIETGLNTSGLVPIYPLTNGLKSSWFRKKLDNLISLFPELPTEYRDIHFPTSKLIKNKADKKLSYSSHLKINLINEFQKSDLGNSLALKILPDIHKKTQKLLPFSLTKDQSKTVNQLYRDLETADPTHRLIQGDTGSGKTATIYFAFNQCIANGYSAALLAPTEILANQHFQNFKKHTLYPSSINLVTKNSKLKAENTPHIYIGTHALLESLPSKLSHPLALLVIDEQHKFGVKQRERLLKRSPIPHLVNLSATPIPRTVALGLLGDISISNINTLPQNRIKTKTHLINKSRLLDGKGWFTENLTKGNQIFIVCPRISTSDSEVDNTEKITQFYKKYFDNRFRITTLHGQQSSEKQQEIISEFKSGKSPILVSTAIIEVGIDIPQANIIIIHSAEQFGLAQLHQLRGRIGRGGEQGHCFLIKNDDTEDETERLTLLKKYHSGLVLAKKDLMLRGAGEVFGIKQHGQMATRLKYFWSRLLFLKAKKDAKELVSRNPKMAKLIASKPIF